MNKSNQPSFLLKNINFNELYILYKKNYFNRPIPNKTKLKLKKAIVCNNTLNNSIKINNNVKNVEYSGQEYVKIYTDKGILKGGRCMFCNKDFETDIIGYPVSYEEKKILTKDNIYNIYH